MDEETITITKKEYAALMDAQDTLIRLESYGVDNWSGYSDALSDERGLFE